MNLTILTILMLGLGIATYSDIKTKEVPNWLSFSLIISIFSFYSFSSLISNSSISLITSLIGFGIFFIIGNLMYYTKQWGGGDAKILMAIGAAIPEYPNFLLKYFNPSLNLNFLIILIINIMLIGAIYSIILGTILGIKNRKKLRKFYEKKRKEKNIEKLNKSLLYFSLIGTILSLIFIKNIQIKISLITLIVLPLILFYLWLIIFAVERASMFKTIISKNLREGDYITHQIKIKDKVIYKPSAEGITIKQIKIMNKNNKDLKIIIRDGIPFLPAITISIIISLIFGNLINYLI